jgi:hypothetical protein
VLEPAERHGLELLDRGLELMPLIPVVGQVPGKVGEVWRDVGHRKVEHHAVERLAPPSSRRGFSGRPDPARPSPIRSDGHNRSMRGRGSGVKRGEDESPCSRGRSLEAKRHKRHSRTGGHGGPDPRPCYRTLSHGRTDQRCCSRLTSKSSSSHPSPPAEPRPVRRPRTLRGCQPGIHGTAIVQDFHTEQSADAPDPGREL